MAFVQAQLPQATESGEIVDINPETLGFSTLAQGGQGVKKLKLLPAPWPNDNTPTSSATLLAIASKRGLIAAAAPEALVLTATDNVRKAFTKDADENDVVSDFSPDVSLTVPRLRQIAFSADEEFLVVSPEDGGGIMVYNVHDLLRQTMESRQRIDTSGVGVKALLPNPAVSEYMVVVLDSGRLHIVNISNGQQKTLPVEGVCSASWSTKGKAFVVGFQDGTAATYMAESLEVRGRLPRPPAVAKQSPLSAVCWLNNNDYFLVHSSANTTQDDQPADDVYHFANVVSPSSVCFQRAAAPLCFSNMDGPVRNGPVRYSVSRLKDWEPALKEFLILASSNSSDLTVLVKTSEKIASDQEEVNQFQRVCPIDSRMAQSPRMSLSDDGDSVLIGEALDLSSRERVTRPAPRLEEVNESPTPLPAYFVLTHEGLLASWWVVWDKSIEERKGYHGLTCFNESSPTESKGQTSFAKPSTAFGAPSKTTFGNATFGTTSTPFGMPASGQKPAFGTPSLGKPTAAPVFGAPQMGTRQSPWANALPTSAAQSVANPFANASTAPSGFSKFGVQASGSESAFSSFNSNAEGQSGFAGLSSQKSAFAGTSNGFKGLSTEPSFGSTVTVESGAGSSLPSWANTPGQKGNSIFGQGTSSFGSTLSKESDNDMEATRRRERDEATPTPQATLTQSKGLFGGANQSFKLGTTFKSDTTQEDTEDAPSKSSGGSLFGNDFGASLSEPKTPEKFEQSSAPQTSTTPTTETKVNPFSIPSTTPATEKKAHVFSQPSSTPATEKVINPFAQTSTTPATEKKSDLPTQSPKTPAFANQANPFSQPLTAPSMQSTTGAPFSSAAKNAETSTPKAAPSKISPDYDDAPLPPDPMTWKSQKVDAEPLPLAGSPPINIDGPEPSDASSSGDEEDDGFSSEEQDGEENTTIWPPGQFRAESASESGWQSQQSVSGPPRVSSAASHFQSYKTTTSTPSHFGQQLKSNPSAFGQPFKSSPLAFAQPTSASASPGFKEPVQQESLSPSRTQSHSTLQHSSLAKQESSYTSTKRREPSPSQAAAVTSEPPPQFSDLVDAEDERIRDLLASDVEPSRVLGEFIAQQQYEGTSQGKTGHAAQIEIIYRDINNMVDTLGLNSRSLQAFLDFHERRGRDEELDVVALEEINEQGEEGPWFDNWCLGEVEDLKILEDKLGKELDDERVPDVLDKLRQLARLNREGARLSTKLNEVRRDLASRKDSEKAETLRKATLPKEMADQQRALRGEYCKILVSLGKAEESMLLLKSKLASRNAQNGRSGGVPTVEAVKRTVNKLILATERKNNDISLLEAQLRKVKLNGSSRPSSSSSRLVTTPSRRALDLHGDNPIMTPPTTQTRMNLNDLNRRVLTSEAHGTPSRGYGFSYSPEGSQTSSNKDLTHLGDLVNDNMSEVVQIARRRRKIASGLASALTERGVKTTVLA